MATFVVNGDVIGDVWDIEEAIDKYLSDHDDQDIDDIAFQRPATVRETLVDEYGDDWERSIYHLIDVGDRRVTQRVSSPAGYPNYSHEYVPCIAISGATSNDCHGYDDPINTSNYRVLQENWEDLEGLSSGWYTNCDVIALDLDKEAPADLITTLKALSYYPVLDESKWSEVEQEFIQEHWESYGRNDVLDAVAKAIGADSCADLTDAATDAVDTLVWGGVLDYGCDGGYPTMSDGSACDFGEEAVAQFIAANVGKVVEFGNWHSRLIDVTGSDSDPDNWERAQTVVDLRNIIAAE